MNAPTAIKGKADQVMDRIVSWLKSGELSVGDKLPSERELAGSFGVSLLTVNKAMARLEDVGMLSRSAGRGTHVARLPSNDAIAIVCDYAHISAKGHPPSNDAAIDTMLSEALYLGMTPHFLLGKGEGAKQFLNSLGTDSTVWRDIKGVIVYGWREGMEDFFESKGQPLVTISTWDQGRHSVIFDYLELGRLAARRLAGKGAGELYVIHNPDLTGHTWNDPLESFLEESSKLGVNPSGIVMKPSEANSPEAGFKAALELSERLQEADGIFITDENIAEGFSKWLEATPSGIPSGCPVVSHANKESARPLSPRIEKCSFSMQSLSLSALEMLLELVSGKRKIEEPCRSWVKPAFEQGESGRLNGKMATGGTASA